MTEAKEYDIPIPGGGGHYWAVAGKRDISVFGNYFPAIGEVRVVTKRRGCWPRLTVQTQKAASLKEARRIVETHLDTCEASIEEAQLEEILALFGGELPPPIELEEDEDGATVLSYMRVHDDGTTVVLRRFVDEYEDVRTPKVVIALGGEEIEEYIEFLAPGAFGLRRDGSLD